MAQEQNILIVDDEKSNLDILINLFKTTEVNYNLIPVLSAKKALQALEKRKVDLILLDIVMPDMDGYELCSLLKAQEETKDIPILFITSNTDDASIAKAYSLGAADYVTKPFRAIELLARVKLNLQLRETIEHLEYLAFYDPMTNIYNRRKFFELAIQRFKGSKNDLYAVMLDIDKFKNINDAYGHSMGDRVIKAVSSTIKEGLEEDMILGRLGGEEFAIVCSADSDEAIVQRVEAIRQKIEDIEMFTDDKVQVGCTISDGIAKYSDELTSIDHLLQKADEALYEAKESGRNKSIFRV